MIMSTTIIVIIVLACVAFVAGTGIFICYSLSQHANRFKPQAQRLNTTKKRSQFVRGLRPSLAERGELPRPKSAHARVQGHRSRTLEFKEMPRRVSEISISYHHRMELMQRAAMRTIREDEPGVLEDESEMIKHSVDGTQMPGTNVSANEIKNSLMDTDGKDNGISHGSEETSSLRAASDMGSDNGSFKGTHNMSVAVEIEQEEDSSATVITKIDVEDEAGSSTKSKSSLRSPKTDPFTTNNKIAPIKSATSPAKRRHSLPHIKATGSNMLGGAAAVKKEKLDDSVRTVKKSNSKQKPKIHSLKRQINSTEIDPEIVSKNKNELNTCQDVE